MCSHPPSQTTLQAGNAGQREYFPVANMSVIERYRHLNIPKFFRGDAAFAHPALYRVLEKEGYRYAIRLKANAVLEREIKHSSWLFDSDQRGKSKLPAASVQIVTSLNRSRCDRLERPVTGRESHPLESKRLFTAHLTESRYRIQQLSYCGGW